MNWPNTEKATLRKNQERTKNAKKSPKERGKTQKRSGKQQSPKWLKNGLKKVT